jgi:hypothetical protein
MAEIVLDQFAGQNWLITPAALALGEIPPKTILDQKWLLVLSGVVVANRQGKADWLSETVSFLPGNSLSLGIGPNEGPLKYAINHYAIPTPSQNPKDYDLVFSLEDFSWAPFVSLSKIFDAHTSIDAGYAVEVWRPRHFMHAVRFPDVTQPIDRIFTGITVDVGIRDTDAFIYKLGYHITLLGRIAFAATGSIG